MSRRQYEQAENQLERDLDDGRITQRQFNEEMKQMARDEREDIEEAAHEAAQAAREEW
jgi:hypothetical protein